MLMMTTGMKSSAIYEGLMESGCMDTCITRLSQSDQAARIAMFLYSMCEHFAKF